jgi:hypothetical protein
MMRSLFVLFLLTVTSFAGCVTTYNVVESAPDYITADSLHNSVHVVSATPILHPGKSLSYSGYLFINEQYQGWHIVDNTTPSSPRNIAFITAPGSLDASISQNALFIENSIDLVVMNIENPSQPVLARRLQSVLPVPVSPRNPAGYYPDAPVIGWHDTVVVVINGGSFA